MWPFLFSPKDQSARQQWSESSPVPKPDLGANCEVLEFFNLQLIQVRQPRPTCPPRGLWQVLRVFWERDVQQGVVRQTHGLWRGHRVVQTSGGGDKIFLIMIMHHYCGRCPDARTSTRKKNNCTFRRLDPSATPWIIYNTNKYIFRDLLSPEFCYVKGFDTRTL